MIELSSETQQATTDQWREKTHALTSEMTEMQRGHSEALKAASRAANYDEEALRMVRCRLFRVLSLCLSRACLGAMIIFIYKWLKKVAIVSATLLLAAARAPELVLAEHALIDTYVVRGAYIRYTII